MKYSYAISLYLHTLCYSLSILGNPLHKIRVNQMSPFDYQRDFSQIDFRQHPEQYRVGRGEQGVLLVEPYKSEILPHWRFKNAGLAKTSAEKIYALFEDYRRQDDFVGMDMARKFIQMGYTRARRYANHQGGQKYDGQGKLLPFIKDDVKAEAAAIFKQYWDRLRADQDYLKRKQRHQAQYG